MNNAQNRPVIILKQLVQKYKDDIIENHGVCEGLLRDFMHEYKLEINLLTAAVKQGLVKELDEKRNAPGGPFFVETLITRFRQHSGISYSYAEWAIKAWAAALGIPVNPGNNLPTGSGTGSPPHAGADGTLRFANPHGYQFVSADNWTPFSEDENGLIHIPASTPLGIRMAEVDMNTLDALLGFILHFQEAPVSALDFGQEVFASGPCTLNDQHLEKIAQYSQIAYLKIDHCQEVSDRGVSHLTNLKHLRHVDISHCTGISQAGLETLAKLPDLESITVNRCAGVNNRTILLLSSNRNLKRLSARGCGGLDSDCLPVLSTMRALQKLDIGDNPLINDEGLVLLKKLDRLESLSLTGCDNITEVSVMTLAALPQLNYLDIRRCRGILPSRIGDIKRRNPEAVILF
jgi:hypothetical protein